jgi:hypothetical protein
MVEKYNDITEQVLNFFFKIFIPSFVAISIKIATQVKKEKLTFMRVIMSFIIGIGCAYFIFPFADNHVKQEYIPLLVGMVSISGEKISEYIIYKWNIDFFLTSIIDAIREGIIKIIKK